MQLLRGQPGDLGHLLVLPVDAVLRYVVLLCLGPTC